MENDHGLFMLPLRLFVALLLLVVSASAFVLFACFVFFPSAL
jgi:hypothetical protein